MVSETLYYNGTATADTNGTDAGDTVLSTVVVPYTGYNRIRVRGTIRVLEILTNSVAQTVTINTKIGESTKATTYVTAALADVNFIPFRHEVEAREGATVSVEVADLGTADTFTKYSVQQLLVEAIF